jgi:hypothetical protein
MPELHLIPGHFYLDRHGRTWCCLRNNLEDKKRPAICVRVADAPLSCTAARYFLNGRRDDKEDPSDLVESVPYQLMDKELG